MKAKIIFFNVFLGIRHILHVISVLGRGQMTNYAILQNAHRIEKGLCIRNPRPAWGYDKANLLLDLIVKERANSKPDAQALKIGKSVLSAYIDYKERTEPHDEKVLDLKKKINKTEISFEINKQFGGSLLVEKKDLLLNEDAIQDLFMTRHSVRDFSDIPVDKCELEKAIRLALRAPSACNRQAFQIYVLNGSDRLKCGTDNVSNADKYLILTGNIRAYTMSELNDWIVSTSIFCAYLSLSLHAAGIGSCFYRKELIKNSEYNNKIRKMCEIPDDEQIVIEMAIGHYKDKFYVPVSCRRDVSEIVHYCH